MFNISKRRRSADIRRTAQRRRFNAVWEVLEDRQLLSGTPTIYTVNKLGDTGTGSGYAGDLRYVINQANANQNLAGSDIRFDPTVFASPETITLSLSLGLVETAGPEVIVGPGANRVTISGNNANGVFVIGYGTTASLSDLTISDGRSGGGGGINSEGTLTVTNCTITNNRANEGGGIYNDPGILTVTNSTFTNNSAIAGGGGIESGGALTVTNSTFINNNATDWGGGIDASSFSSTTTIVNSSITNSSANDGGGLNISGTVVITNSTIANNTSPYGGIVFNGSTLTVTNSTIANNQAILAHDSASKSYYGGYGGGIYCIGTSLRLVNDTIANNIAASDGGGLDLAYGTATINNTIVALNQAGALDLAGDISLYPGGLGGTGGTMDTANSHNNLIGIGGSGGLVSGVNGNQVSVANPGLATALADNGGPTQTIALLKGSPAIDAGSVALAVDANGNPLTTDQRGTGFPRIVNNTVDIGAYEFQAPAPLATHLVVTAQPPGSVTAGSGFSLVVAAENSLGNVDPTFNGNVTVALANNLGDSTLGGTLTVAAKNGTATFSGLSFNNPGNGYTLLVTASGVSSATTSAINVSALAPPPSPIISFQLVLFTQKRNKRGRPVGRPIPTGFEFGFNRAMNPATAGNPANYAITTYVQVRKRVGRRTVKVLQLQPVRFSVSFDSSNNTVKLLLAGRQTFSRGGQITLVATPRGGIDSIGGGFLDGNGDGVGGDNAVFNISVNARRLSHA